MGPAMRVVVAMSGGVDSSVAAARLHAAGHEVIGVTLHLWDYPDDGTKGRCCAPEDQYDAKRTADALGFPHYSFDRRALFEEKVVAPFVEAYLAGETPSPCTACNRGVKLKELFRIAEKLGAEKVATGHYARLGETPQGHTFLARGRDPEKDQSYFLYATSETDLRRLLFPLGDSTKAEVRAEADALSLPGAHKGESQELCFVGGGEYANFVEARATGRVRPGPIVDASGKRVGMHAGIHRYTIGQRKGIGVALGHPVFVSRIDPISSTVHLGDEGSLLARSARLTDVILAAGVSLPLLATARVRYRHDGVAATVENGPRGVEVRFREPARAVTVGQVAVFYDGDRVLGGGRIESVETLTMAPAHADALSGIVAG